MSSGVVDALAEVFSAYSSPRKSSSKSMATKSTTSRGASNWSAPRPDADMPSDAPARRARALNVSAAAPPIPPLRSRDSLTEGESNLLAEAVRSARKELSESFRRQRGTRRAELHAEDEARRQEHEREVSLREGLKAQLYNERDKSRYLELQVNDKDKEIEELKTAYSECLTKLAETLRVCRTLMLL